MLETAGDDSVDASSVATRREVEMAFDIRR